MRAVVSQRWLVALALTAGACHGASPARTEATDSAFRAELLARVAEDQAVRDTFAAELRAAGRPSVAVIRRMSAVDSANTAWLKPRVLAAGWPTVAQVGRDGMEAAFLLVQHADNDPAFQERALPLLETAYRAGAVDGQELALLTDRVLKARGRLQRFGTQATVRDGRLTIDPIEDSAGVDARRAALGLPPLAEYRRMLDSAYAPTRQ
jgi:hypothetical protein